METLSILVGVLLCLVVIEGRHFEDRLDDTVDLESQDGAKKYSAEPSRHRRRRWQNYGYEYPVPAYPFPYPDRRDYDKNQPDYLPRIVKLLEEISAYIRRPPAPPQPVYVPYPVPYPVPQYTNCQSNQGAKKPNVTSRFPEMEDTNQNWGLIPSDDEGGDDGNDGARPISFDPIKPYVSTKRPAPSVEHGSVQADNQPTTKEPRFAESNGRNPDICSAAILSCCSDSNQYQCFQNFGCGNTYYRGNACSKASINGALESFKVAYSPAV